ncbi:MAG: hypothetical protein IPP72_13735 [Chitinophagaceae bacterium]|nr:hypothetical protein [Chitinophagaceae bacterium]
MKTLIGLFAILILLASFSSCQKNVVDDFPNGFQNDSSYLKKVISFDTTRPAGLDTGIVHEYFYDNLKIVIKPLFTEYGVGGVQYTHTSRFYYLNVDTLPFKMVESAILIQTAALLILSQ